MGLFQQLATMRGEIESMLKDKKGYTNNYAPLPSILEMINPLLAKYELACVISAPDYKVDPDGVRVYRFEVLLGYGEEKYITYFNIPEAIVPAGKKKKDATGNETEVSEEEFGVRSKAKAIQNFGATVTYGERYIYQAIFGIPIEEDDPDGSVGDTKNIPDNDIIWFMNNIPKHNLSKNFTDAQIVKQLKLVLKGNISKEDLIKKGY